MKYNNIDKKRVVEQVKNVIECKGGDFPILGGLDFVVYDIDDTSCFIQVTFKCAVNVYKCSVLREECRLLVRLLYAETPDLIELGLRIKIWDMEKDADVATAFVCGLTIIDDDFYQRT